MLSLEKCSLYHRFVTSEITRVLLTELIRIPWSFSENKKEMGIESFRFLKYSCSNRLFSSRVFVISRPASLCETSTDYARVDASFLFLTPSTQTPTGHGHISLRGADGE